MRIIQYTVITHHYKPRRRTEPRRSVLRNKRSRYIRVQGCSIECVNRRKWPNCAGHNNALHTIIRRIMQNLCIGIIISKRPYIEHNLISKYTRVYTAVLTMIVIVTVIRRRFHSDRIWSLMESI